MMTTFAALLGAVPLAVTTGSGAEMRQPLGISIVGGLIFSQVLTLYTTPVVYMYLDRFRLWLRRVAPRGGAHADRRHAAATTHMMRNQTSRSRLCSLGGMALLALAACAVGPELPSPGCAGRTRLQGGSGLEAGDAGGDRGRQTLVVDL